jgi:tetratricopeptide (TPR) repeat protein
MDSLEYIDSYFGGGPSPEEATRFEKRMQEDPAFVEEVAFYLGTLAASREANVQELRTRFAKLYRQQARPAELKKMNPRRWIPLAAAAALLAVIALAWLLFLRPADPSKLADRYIRQNLTVLPVKMGGTDRVQSAIILYNTGRSAESLQQFEELLRSDSLHPTALLTAGIVSLRMESYDKALDFFIKLQRHTDPHVNPALFYEALTLMRRNHTGDSDHAKHLLTRIVQEDLNKKRDAQDLLSKM